MDFAAILKGLELANQAMQTLPQLLENANRIRASLGPVEQEQLDAELAKIKPINDQLFQRLDVKLDQASRR